MITAEEMAVVDANAAALGVLQKQLMESSGNAVARCIREHAAPGDRVTILAGRGNNGGDSFVAARFLDEFGVQTLLLGRAETISTEIARENWEALQRAEYDVREIRDSEQLDLGNPDVIVDALLGTGVRGAPREPERSAIEEINAADATVIAVDVPSGVDVNTGERMETAVVADYIVTFHAMKPGLESLSAPVTVADIGIPAMAETAVGPGDLLNLDRSPDSHKGDHGELLVIGGGPYTGAPALAAQAALAAGADIVRVAAPETVVDTVQSYNEALITQSLDGERLGPDHVEELLEIAQGNDSVVLGPGLGSHEETFDAVREFLMSFEGTCLIDADPLGLVPEIETEATLICTPHTGEFRRMGGDPSEDWRDRMEDVRDQAAAIDATILLKGPYDILSNGERTRVNRTGTPAMTVGGTGDVLAGTTGALAARADPMDAAALGAYVTGRAGERCVEDRATLTPRDLLAAIPEVRQT